MAQKTIVTLVDGLTGFEADEAVQFGLDGVTYEIDLSDTNAKGLRGALGEYIPHARRQGGHRSPGRRGTRPSGATSRPGTSGATSVDREQNHAIREWARKQGYEVSDRGRVPSNVTEAYHQQH